MKVYEPRHPGAPITFANTKPVVIADHIGRLQGPDHGRHTLPPHLDWTPTPTYDLDHHPDARTMYETVLREARQDDDLTILNARLLQTLWDTLNLTEFVRTSWERQHPELVAA